jgi:hypothetical protein
MMAEYRVVHDFSDLQDNSREYHMGDSFPRPGYEPSAQRLEELAGNDNKQHCPLIEKIAQRGRKRKSDN